MFSTGIQSLKMLKKWGGVENKWNKQKTAWQNDRF